MSATLAPTAPETRSGLVQAASEVGVIWLGLFALGAGFGVLVTSHGLPWWLAPVISASMFAGSVEFLLIGMFATATPVATIAVTTFLVNSRHLFYGLTFPLHRVRGRLARAYSVFALCDEAYAILTTKDPDALSSSRITWTQFGLHASWAGGALAGGLLGGLIPDLPGLDFILTALFVVLAIDAYRDRPDRVTLGLAALAAAVALLVAPGSMLLVAMAVFTVTLLIRHHRSRHA
ncbi:MAG: AzlC family ABC transporter permease [Actinobacteria bacterium]|nr:AzlC family ABC transporter permease [Actinomycetota bacterium]